MLRYLLSILTQQHISCKGYHLLSENTPVAYPTAWNPNSEVPAVSSHFKPSVSSSHAGFFWPPNILVCSQTALASQVLAAVPSLIGSLYRCSLPTTVHLPPSLALSIDASSPQRPSQPPRPVLVLISCMRSLFVWSTLYSQCLGYSTYGVDACVRVRYAGAWVSG